MSGQTYVYGDWVLYYYVCFSVLDLREGYLDCVLVYAKDGVIFSLKHLLGLVLVLLTHLLFCAEASSLCFRSGSPPFP